MKKNKIDKDDVLCWIPYIVVGLALIATGIFVHPYCWLNVGFYILYTILFHNQWPNFQGTVTIGCIGIALLAIYKTFWHPYVYSFFEMCAEKIANYF